MDSHRFSRRAITHDSSSRAPRSDNLLPWTQIVTKKHRTHAPWKYDNSYYSPAYSRFYSHVTPQLHTIAEESLIGTIVDRDHRSTPYGNKLTVRENYEQAGFAQPGYEQSEQTRGKKQCVQNNERRLSDEYHRSNVDDGILTTSNVRLHDLLSRQKIVNQFAPSSPVDERELKETFPGSIFEKTEHEKCMPMVRANSPNTFSANEGKEYKNNILVLDQPINLDRRDSEIAGFKNFTPNITSYYPPSNYRWVDSFDTRERLPSGRFRNYGIYSGSGGKDRIDELSRLVGDNNFIDPNGYRENDFIDMDGNLVCIDCMNEQTQKPGAICRRCQYARINRELAKIQKKAYDIYMETGQLAKKPGDTVEVVNYRDDDVRRYRRVRGKNNIRKMFNRIGTRGYLTGRRNSADGYLYGDDFDDDEFDDGDNYHGYDDDQLVNECEVDRFVDNDSELVAVNSGEKGENNKRKKKKISKRQSVRNVKSSRLNDKKDLSNIRISSFPKRLELVRKNSVDSWLKKRGVFVSNSDIKSKSKRTFRPKSINRGKRKALKS